MVPKLPVRTFAVVLLLAIVASPLGARPEGTTRIPLPHPLPTETDWYGIYQGREKKGWARLGIELGGEGEDSVYVSRSDVEATLTGFGTLEFRFETVDTFRGSPPFELLRSREYRRDGSVERRATMERREDGTYVAEVVEGEETRTERFPALDYTLADRLCHVHWAMARPKEGDEIRVSEFDLTELRPDVYTYRVQKEHRLPARGVEITVYEMTMRSDRKGPLGTLWIDTEGRMIRGPLAREVAEMRVEPERQAKEPRFASDLFGFGRVPVNLPIGDPRSVTRLVLALYGRGADRFQPGPRQQTTRYGDADRVVILGKDVEGADLATEEEQAAARPQAPVDPALVELARQATEGTETPEEAARALLRFTASYLEDVHLARPYPVEDLLVEKVGDARDHARLFLALARAHGIPAREVYGLVYLGDEALAFGGHAWAEVVLDGRWVPVDPTWVQMPVDATHVALARDGDWVGMLAALGRLGAERRSVGRD